MTNRIAIVGAGISGLAAALQVRQFQPDVQVVVYEASDRVGGTIRSEHVDGFTLEGGPDSFLTSKPGGIALVNSLGLAGQMVGTLPAVQRSYVLRNGSLLPFPRGLSGLVPAEIKPLLTSSLLSPIGKIRLFGDLVIPPKQSIEDESLASFVTRRVGTELYERIMEPLLSGIFAGDGEKLSLAATAPQLRAAEQSHGGLIRGAMAKAREASQRDTTSTGPRGFASFSGGMGVLTETAATTVRESGTQLCTGVRCEAITREERGFLLTLREGDRTFTDRVSGVVLAVQGWAAAPLLEGVAPGAAAAMKEIEYVSNALVSVAFPAVQLRAPITGYGYVVPRAERRDVTAMTWMSSKWANRAPGGSVVIRAFFGRAGRMEVLNEPDNRLVTRVVRELNEVMGLTVTPTLTRVHRIDRGMPQYNMGHLQRVDVIEAALAESPGLQIAGNMFRGVGIPDCISSGQNAARNVVSDLQLMGILPGRR